MKRFISSVLALVIVALMIPQTAFAATKKTTDYSSQIKIIAEYNYKIFDISNDRNYIAVVQNNSDTVLRIDAKGYAVDATGAIVEVQEDVIRTLAPGKQAVLDFWFDNDDGNQVGYKTEIKAKKSSYDKDYSNNIVYTMNPTSNSAIVKLSNTGTKTADVTAQAIFLKGTEIAYFDYDVAFYFDPGQSTAIQLESGGRSFDNCLIYVQSSYWGK